MDKDDKEKEFNVAHSKMTIHLQAQTIPDIAVIPSQKDALYYKTLPCLGRELEMAGVASNSRSQK